MEAVSIKFAYCRSIKSFPVSGKQVVSHIWRRCTPIPHKAHKREFGFIEQSILWSWPPQGKAFSATCQPQFLPSVFFLFPPFTSSCMFICLSSVYKTVLFQLQPPRNSCVIAALYHWKNKVPKKNKLERTALSVSVCILSYVFPLIGTSPNRVLLKILLPKCNFFWISPSFTVPDLLFPNS